MTARRLLGTCALFIACSCFSPHPAHSQIDTSLRAYFPLHVGDYWEYVETDFPLPPSFGYAVKVDGDTIMPNGRAYRVFHQQGLYPLREDLGDEYYRMDDSLQVYQYRGAQSCPEGEELRYKLAAPDSTLWAGCPSSPDVQRDLQRTFDYQYPTLSHPLTTKSFGLGYINPVSGDTEYYFWGPDYWLAKGIGLARILPADIGSIVDLTGAVIDGITYGTITAVDGDGGGTPLVSLKTFEAFPNPFNAMTTIRFRVGREQYVSLKIYDMIGREVESLLSQMVMPGMYSIGFNGSMLPSGVYVMRMQNSGGTESHRLMLLR